MNVFDWLRRSDRREGFASRRLQFHTPWVMRNHALQNSEVVYAAVSRIATTFGAAPCGLYKGNDAQTDNALHRLVAVQPNDNLTPFELFRALEVCRLTSGNGYALLLPAGDNPAGALMLVDPGDVTPMRDKETGDIWYKLSQQEYGTSYWHNRHMLHVRNLSPDGVVGLNPIEVLRGTLDYSAQVATFSLEHLRNGVHAGLVVDFPAELSKSKRDDAVRFLLESYKDSGGAVLALDAGVRATRMDGSMVDPKLLDVDKITRARVAAVYNLPPHMLGDYTNSSYSSLEEEMLEFVGLTLKPIVELYRQEFNRKLLTTAQQADRLTFRWDLTDLAQPDSTTRARTYFQLVRSAGVTPNELRAAEGRPPLEGGDRLYVSRDMIALDDLDALTPGGVTVATPTPEVPDNDAPRGGRQRQVRGARKHG